MTLVCESPVLDAVSARTTRPGVRDGYLTIGSGLSRDEAYASLRRSVALVDCSYFGKLALAGRDALHAADRLVLDDVRRLPVNRIASTFLVRADGAPLCHALVVNEGDGCLLLTEGAHPAAVAEHVSREAAGASVTDLTEDVALIGVDGPCATDLLRAVAGDDLPAAGAREVVRTLDLGGRPVTMYRTANTGGDGWLLRVHADAAPGLWRTLAACGASRGLVECGFEDVDLCKLENGVVNMEREGSQVESVVELRPVGAPMPDKADYVGRHAVERALRRGVRRRLVGLAVGRPGAGGCDAPAVDVGAPVRCAGADAGTVVNAAYSPGLGRWIATALLDAGRARPGLECHVGIDGSALRATTVAPPFVARGPRAA